MFVVPGYFLGALALVGLDPGLWIGTANFEGAAWFRVAVEGLVCCIRCFGHIGEGGKMGCKGFITATHGTSQWLQNKLGNHSANIPDVLLEMTSRTLVILDISDLAKLKLHIGNLLGPPLPSWWYSYLAIPDMFVVPGYFLGALACSCGFGPWTVNWYCKLWRCSLIHGSSGRLGMLHKMFWPYWWGGKKRVVMVLLLQPMVLVSGIKTSWGIA